MRPEGYSYLPPGYRLDESDPEVLVVRREDGAQVAYCSAHGATREAVEESAWEDYKRRREEREL